MRGGKRLQDLARLRTQLLGLGPGVQNQIEDSRYIALAATWDRRRDEENLAKLIVAYEGEVDHDRAEVWVPIHAWRILAMWKSPLAIEPMLVVAGHDDDVCAYRDFEDVCAAVGAAAGKVLIPVLRDRKRSDIPRLLAAKGLGNLQAVGSTLRTQIAASLTRQLATTTGAEEGDINGAVVEALVKLGANSARKQVWASYLAGHAFLGAGADAYLEAAFGPVVPGPPTKARPRPARTTRAR